MAKQQSSLIPAERIERAIIVIRGEKVMLDSDPAALYGVPTKHLLQAVRRNESRCPADFMFQLSTQEADVMRSQFVTASKRNIRYAPYAFTEQRVAMLSSVLRSKRAVDVNISIMRAFVRLRQLLASHADLAHKLDALEKKYDKQFAIVFEAIRKLMEPPSEGEIKEMGYHTLISKSDGKASNARRIRSSAK
jgi:hypothetical protein